MVPSELIPQLEFMHLGLAHTASVDCRSILTPHQQQTLERDPFVTPGGLMNSRGGQAHRHERVGGTRAHIWNSTDASAQPVGRSSNHGAAGPTPIHLSRTSP